MKMDVMGQVITGEVGNILVRQKHEKEIELGSLLVVEEDNSYKILQAYNLGYGSQIRQEMLELMSGMELEGSGASLEFMDPKLRNYTLASVKSLVDVKKLEDKHQVKVPKTLPRFFSNLREIKDDDLSFITTPENPIYLGKIRSGSRILDVDINLEGESVLRHHILVPATTGKGKSNLVKVMLWSILEEKYCGILVLDPHDEYYGTHSKGLSHHPQARNNLLYYSSKSNLPPGAISLRINITQLKPWHFRGVIDFSTAQLEAIYAYYNKYENEWVSAAIKQAEVKGDFRGETKGVLSRRLSQILDINFENDNLQCNGIFTDSGGENTILDIQKALEEGKTVIIDTSILTGSLELLIGSIITSKIFNHHKRCKAEGTLEQKPVVSIILEEAPRVIGKDSIAKGDNIFSTIAREGRKFKIGLVAITQLPSLIPREILANINTKIILGVEMAPERRSLIDSASQDLSTDDRAIASLDTGEAIISSSFTKFAVPIKVPLFEDYVKKSRAEKPLTSFGGVEVK